MNPLALILLAFSMSTDAFSVAIGKGASLNNPRLSQALKLGLIFGTIEAITPIIGWLLGRFATGFVDPALIEAWDHWIAFIILSALGLHLIVASLSSDNEEEDVKSSSNPALLTVMLTAFGTSIDAMAIGVSLAFIEVNILVAAGLIGFATFLMVTIGVMLGKALGAILGHRAEMFGGVVLIAIGSWTLLSHTGYL